MEKRTLEQQLSNMKSNAAELEHILQKSHADKTGLESRLADLSARLQEQIKLRESDGHLQQQYNSQLAKVGITIPHLLIMLVYSISSLYQSNVLWSVYFSNTEEPSRKVFEFWVI